MQYLHLEPPQRPVPVMAYRQQVKGHRVTAFKDGVLSKTEHK